MNHSEKKHKRDKGRGEEKGGGREGGGETNIPVPIIVAPD